MTLDDNATLIAYNLFVGIVAWIATTTGISVVPAMILGVLMFMDFLAAMASAYKRGEEITSRKMNIGALGKLLTMGIPLTIALMAKGTDLDLSSFLVWCIYVLIISEGYSVISNVVNFHTGKNLPEIDAISLIGSKVRDIVRVIFPKTKPESTETNKID